MSYKNNDDTLILLNDFIIEIINKHKYFTDTEYNSIKNINNNCKIDKDNDCQCNIKNKTDIQHYTFYFLLEYIKNITSCNNKNNIT
jgi:hypothetical protein